MKTLSSIITNLSSLPFRGGLGRGFSSLPFRGGLGRGFLLLSLFTFPLSPSFAQNSDAIPSVITVVGETKTLDTPQDTATVEVPELPVWKKKLYYGYKFDIYYHHDTRSDRKENGWSIAVEPEIGWRHSDRFYFGLRIGGGYQDSYTTYTREAGDGSQISEQLRVMQGTWEVTPYTRYRLKTLFNDKVGIWIEAHLYAGMQFPRVTDGIVSGTDYEGLRQCIVYGAQVSPVITYQFNRKSTFQIFFSILSFGYSGTTFCYIDPLTDKPYNEYTHDVIVFSGKLRNLLANQFTPGLYGLRLGVQKSF